MASRSAHAGTWSPEGSPARGTSLTSRSGELRSVRSAYSSTCTVPELKSSLEDGLQALAVLATSLLKCAAVGMSQSL